MRIVKFEKHRNVKAQNLYTLSDGSQHTSVLKIAKYAGLPFGTVDGRIRKHGVLSPSVLVPFKKAVDHEVSGVAGQPQQSPITKISHVDKDFRKKCKRDSSRVLCKKYHDCQSSRLGMKGYPKWSAPANTDSCFEAETAPVGNFSNQPLAGATHTISFR